MAEKKQAPLNKLLTIYFYHTRLTRESYEEWKEYKFPGHILYGLPLLENYGIHSVMHKCKYFSGRLKLMLYATKEILFCKEKYDVLYATSFRGIEPVIFLRALGLYRKPIVIWHHTAVVTNPKPWREQISRLFYKGIDQMFLFSRKLIQDSQKTPEYADFSGWAAGFDSFSVSFSDLHRLRRHIEEQHTIHQEISFEEEYGQLLEENGFDPHQTSVPASSTVHFSANTHPKNGIK